MRINPIIFPLLAYLPLATACGGDTQALPAAATLPSDAASPDPTVITLPDLDLGPSPEGTTSPNAILGSSTFRLRNTGSQTLFLRRGCDVEVRISPTSGEWQTSSMPACACDCADPTCVHMDCPGCPDFTVVPLATGAAIEVSWLPRISRRQRMATDAGDPLCANHQALPPGPYLAHVATFPTAGDATTGMNQREIVTPFSLQPTPSIIEVDLP